MVADSSEKPPSRAETVAYIRDLLDELADLAQTYEFPVVAAFCRAGAREALRAAAEAQAPPAEGDEAA